MSRQAAEWDRAGWAPSCVGCVSVSVCESGDMCVSLCTHVHVCVNPSDGLTCLYVCRCTYV